VHDSEPAAQLFSSPFFSRQMKRKAADISSDDAPPTQLQEHVNKKGRVEHKMYIIVNAHLPRNTTVETDIFALHGNPNGVARIWHLLKDATQMKRSGIAATIVGGLTITPCHWNLVEYAGWHGVGKNKKLALAYIDTAITLIEMIMAQEDVRVIVGYTYPVAELVNCDGRVLLIECERNIPV
jgi:hypothetical protein